MTIKPKHTKEKEFKKIIFDMLFELNRGWGRFVKEMNLIWLIVSFMAFILGIFYGRILN